MADTFYPCVQTDTDWRGRVICIEWDSATTLNTSTSTVFPELQPIPQDAINSILLSYAVVCATIWGFRKIKSVIAIF